MTKVYKINGRRIESLWSDCSHKDLWMQVDQLLEALDEKKEEKIREPEGKQVSYPRDEKREKMAQDANYKNMPEYGEFWRNVKRSSIEEPKPECKGDCYFCNPLGWADRNPASTVTTESSEKMRLEHIKNKEPKSTLKEVKVDKDTFDNVPNYKIHLPDCACGNHTKSTLREATLKIVRTVADLQAEPVADKIISLFKDTLLKEVKKAEPLRIPGESLEFTSGQEWTMRQIKQIIKNL